MEQTLVYAVIAVLLAIVSVQYYALVRNRKKRNASDAEIKIKNMELTKAKLQFQHYEKLMEGFAQRVLDKNKIIIDLEKKIKPIPASNSSDQPVAAKLEELLSMKLVTEDDWIYFQQLFRESYPGYIQNITNDFHDLTSAELRMLLLMKLKVNKRNIASRLGISLTSVHKTRYRLKKKLNLLEEDDDLEKYADSYDKIVEMYKNDSSGYQSVNKEGLITEMNDTQLKWLEYARGEVIGKMPVRNIISDESISILEYYFPRFRSGRIKTMIDVDMKLKRKDGTSFPVIANSISIFHSDGTFRETRSCLFDNSENGE